MARARIRNRIHDYRWSIFLATKLFGFPLASIFSVSLFSAFTRFTVYVQNFSVKRKKKKKNETEPWRVPVKNTKRIVVGYGSFRERDTNAKKFRATISHFEIIIYSVSRISIHT